MQNTGKRLIWDELNNCELKVEHSELPETIRQAVEDTIADNISRCLDPKKSKGSCLRMADELMINMAALGKKPFIDCRIIHTKKPHPHFWLLVDDWHIDLTARQFNPLEVCPKIWKNDGLHSGNLYFVERGKGPVLFKLVPFNKESIIYPVFRSTFSFLKSNQKKLMSLMGKKLNEVLSYLPKVERSFGGDYQ